MRERRGGHPAGGATADDEDVANRFRAGRHGAHGVTSARDFARQNREWIAARAEISLRILRAKHARGIMSRMALWVSCLVFAAGVAAADAARVDGARIRAADAREWLSYGRTY